jgi:iron(III) transport system ATP-binding protein
MDEMRDMLGIRGLTVRYGDVRAVADFELSLAAGEIVTLLGPTGCGKSSVLRAVAGMEPVAEGEIRIGSTRIDARHDVPPEKRGVGLVFQDFALFPHLTVAQNVAFRVRDAALADRWIADLGLEAFRNAWPETLSGGQKQRVALARCLAHEPRVVLLDEPLSNLDAALKASLRWQIRDALKAAGVPAIWVTHDQDEALSVGDRVAIMTHGRLVQVDEPETCFRAPADRFVARFLGEGAFLAGALGEGEVHTALGCSAAVVEPTRAPAPNSPVDVLVRPHDLRVEATADGNAEVLWARYEGETRLYGVRLEGGEELQVRTGHEVRFATGETVAVRIGARHALAVFPVVAS